MFLMDFSGKTSLEGNTILKKVILINFKPQSTDKEKSLKTSVVKMLEQNNEFEIADKKAWAKMLTSDLISQNPIF